MSSSPSPSPLLPFLERWGIVVLVAPLYLLGLNRWPVWEAEIWTQRTCVVPFREMLALVAEDKHPPLFFMLEWLLLHLHASDAVARLPAMVFGLAAIVVLQRVVERHFGQPHAWFATLLLAFSPYMVTYSANARSGTLTILLGAVALGVGLDLVAGDRPRRAALGLSASLLIGVYVHYDMFLALGGAALGGIFGLLLDDRPRRERLSRLGLGVVSLLVPVLAFLPWLLGPMQRQQIEDPEHAQERTFRVLRYLLWPVGPEYIAAGAVLLLLAAILGLLYLVRRNARSGMLLGWAVAAVAIPYLWSTTAGTLGKYYLYAPFQGFFILLAAAGLVAGTTFLSRFLPPRAAIGLLSLGVVAGSIRPLYDVLVPYSNLVSVSLTTPGVWDGRMDANAILNVPVGRLPGIIPVDGAGQSFLHYAPPLDIFRVKPGEQRRTAWKALSHTQDSKLIVAYRAEARTGCLLAHAFSDMLLVEPPLDCQKVLDYVRELGEKHNHGPFLMETAVQAALKKDWERAEKYARLSAEHSPVSSAPNILLAGILIDSGRPADAMTTIEAGLDKAARYRQRNEWTELARLKLEAAQGTRDPQRIGEAEKLQSCLNENLYSIREGWCQGGIFWLL